jgi:predicted DNA-binding ArsR family transcriptional regulator
MRYIDLEEKYESCFDEFLYEELININKSIFECDSIYIELDIEFIFETKHKHSEDGEEFLYDYKDYEEVEIRNYYIELRDYNDVLLAFSYQSNDDEEKSIIKAIEIASQKLFEKYPELLN